MNQKNSDLPAYPIAYNNQFGQLVVLGGITKVELVAIELLKQTKILSFEDNIKAQHAIKESYHIAELFCSYIEDKIEQKSEIIS